ncbi:hypothetical protein MHIP_02130 [Mycolicibacterium hippocampi]|uniref:Uncharacterized protein n=1 Tax=Mycolicibacterium hippocampi TaxID=659824 RepID=A0A7I9ZFC6_9MYCO|nr:hypothetical protein MHIP_02130 [Mycolicibacterium hippocampi]
MHNVSPLTTSPEPPPSVTGESAWAGATIPAVSMAPSATITAETVSVRPLVLKNHSPIDVPDPVPEGTQAVYLRSESFSATPRGNIGPAIDPDT